MRKRVAICLGDSEDEKALLGLLSGDAPHVFAAPTEVVAAVRAKQVNAVCWGIDATSARETLTAVREVRALNSAVPQALRATCSAQTFRVISELARNGGGSVSIWLRDFDPLSLLAKDLLERAPASNIDLVMIARLPSSLPSGATMIVTGAILLSKQRRRVEALGIACGRSLSGIRKRLRRAALAAPEEILGLTVSAHGIGSMERRDRSMKQVAAEMRFPSAVRDLDVATP